MSVVSLTLITSTKGSKLITHNSDTEIRSAELIGDFTPADPEWHELRLTGISGTDAGTILGVNPYASAYSLWAQKTGRVTRDIEQNQRMRLGQLLEGPLLQMFAESNPNLKVETCGTYRSKEFPWMIANPDALAWDGDKLYIVEVKTARQYWDEIPPHYIAQVLHYADVFDADGITLVALTGGDYREYSIPFEREMVEAQREAMLSFWELIEEDLEPQWDGSQATYDTVREMQSGDMTEESIDIGELGVLLSNAQANYKAAEEELNTCKSATLAQMGDAKYAITTEGGAPVLVAVKRSRNGGKPWLEVKG